LNPSSVRGTKSVLLLVLIEDFNETKILSLPFFLVSLTTLFLKAYCSTLLLFSKGKQSETIKRLYLSLLKSKILISHYLCFSNRIVEKHR